MKTEEEIVKSINVVVSSLEIQKLSDRESIRKLGAIEGFLIVLGYLDMDKPLEYLADETYKQCVLRHVWKFLKGL
jgi:hypothetical protein